MTLSKERLPFAAAIAGMGLALSLTGLFWCLPDRSRAMRVLPPGADSPEFRASLENSWKALQAHIGPDNILSPDAFYAGFSKEAAVEPGWTVPPPLLMNSARSFHLRSAYEDEANILRAVAKLKPHRLQLNPRHYFYGSGYIYPLAAWIGALSLVTPAELVGGVGYYLEHVDKMAWIYRLGRTLSTVIYLTAAALLFCAGKRFFGEDAGLWAAALFVVSPMYVLHSHFMKPHVLGAVFTLLCYFKAAEYLETGETRRLILAGASAGLAAACLSHLATSSWIVFSAVLLKMRIGGDWKTESKKLAFAALACGAAFLIASPYYLTETQTVLQALAKTQRPNPSLLNIPHFWVTGIPSALTIPGAVCVLYGTVNRKNLDSPVRMLLLVSFFGLLATAYFFPHVHLFDSARYCGGLILGLLLAGAALSKGGAAARILGATAVLFGAAASGVLSWNHHLDAPGTSTRDEAGAWIENHIPAGSELGFIRLPQPSNSPYFQWNKYRMRFIENKAFAAWKEPDALPAYMVLTFADGDEIAPLRKTLPQNYSLLRTFRPFGFGPIRYERGETGGNPRIQIYKRRF